MSKYRPVLINIDNEGVKMAKKRSNEKLALFNKAIDWIKNKKVSKRTAVFIFIIVWQLTTYLTYLFTQ